MVERRYVDVNVFVYWLSAHPIFGESARRWVNEIEKAKAGEYITSTLTIYEALVILAGLTGRSLKDEGYVGVVIEAITGLSKLAIEPLTLDDIVRAVEHMKTYNLDYEDALHLAVALRSGASKIISNDRDFDRTPLKRIF